MKWQSTTERQTGEEPTSVQARNTNPTTKQTYM